MIINVFNKNCFDQLHVHVLHFFTVNSITLNYIDVVDQPLEFQLKVLQFIYWVKNLGCVILRDSMSKEVVTVRSVTATVYAYTEDIGQFSCIILSLIPRQATYFFSPIKLTHTFTITMKRFLLCLILYTYIGCFIGYGNVLCPNASDGL